MREGFNSRLSLNKLQKLRVPLFLAESLTVATILFESITDPSPINFGNLSFLLTVHTIDIAESGASWTLWDIQNLEVTLQLS